LKGFTFGLLYGAASPVPGISGGTLFVFLNIYEDVFISASWANIKKNLSLVISFLIGCGVGLLGISHVIMYLLGNYERIMYFSFIGLILGCIPNIYKKATVVKIKAINGLIFAVALAFMLLLTFSGGELSTNSSLEQLGSLTPNLLLWIFIASIISSMAMLIPGVGGSIMMLALGIYTIFIEAVSTFNLVLLSVLTVAMILGTLLGVIAIKKLLNSYPQTLYCAILGFIIGSIFIIYPGFSANLEGLISLIFVALFAVFAFWLSKKG